MSSNNKPTKIDNIKKAEDLKKLSLADIGLTQTKRPAVLTQTKSVKKHEKLLAKKEKTQRVKAAMTELAEQKEEIEQHRIFVAEEKRLEVAKKGERKMKLHQQHVDAQEQRRKTEEEKEAQRMKDQKQIVKKHFEDTREKEKKEKERKQQVALEMEELGKAMLPTCHVAIHRVTEIEESRKELPVLSEEQAITEAINEAPGNTVLICGETGSGKTTQVPQFLWECGYGHPVEGKAAFRGGLIGITEPRRVAAIAMSERVAYELNEPYGETVCYQVRHQNNLHPHCQLKFMTEGILLREIQGDFLLSKYSVIVVDEAHERSVSCDVLLGLLSRIVPLRQSLFDEWRASSSNALMRGKKTQIRSAHQGKEEDQQVPAVTPLKLIIMSATLRVSDFKDNAKLFPKEPPLINVDVRQFPVSIHFSRKTELHRYVEEAYKKVRQIHKKLPPGGILVFLSTQREIHTLCEMLETHYQRTRICYDDQKYRKHSLLPSRQEKHNSNDNNNDGPEEGGGGGRRKEGNSEEMMKAREDEENLDAFGLRHDEYALEGDEDFQYDEEDNDEGKTTKGGGKMPGGLVDDFDYFDGVRVGAHEKQQLMFAAEQKGKEEQDNENIDMGKSRKRTRREQEVRQNKTTDDHHDVNSKATKKKKIKLAAGLKKKRVEEELGVGKGSKNAFLEEIDEWEGESDEGEEGDTSEEESDPLNAKNNAPDGAFEEEEEKAKQDDENEAEGELNTLHILPLYSLLSPDLQKRVFEAAPPGKRLCVIATNIAETSITIPNIRYVVDTGRVKAKSLELDTGAQLFRVQWTSQASAAQRSGRSGRTGPGHCYRLFSTAVHTNWMDTHTDPEILRTPLESVVLMMKQMRIDHIARFPFPTPPTETAIRLALLRLRVLGAVDGNFRCQEQGNKLAMFPIPPQFSQIILGAYDFFDAHDRATTSSNSISFTNRVSGGEAKFSHKAAEILQEACLMAAAVSSTTMDVWAMDPSSWMNENKQDQVVLNQNSLKHPGSDLITFIRVLEVFNRQSVGGKKQGGGQPSVSVCAQYGLHYKTCVEAWQLKKQLAQSLRELQTQPPQQRGGMMKGRDQKFNVEQAPTTALEDYDGNEELVTRETVEQSNPQGNERAEKEQKLKNEDFISPPLHVHLTKEMEIQLRKFFMISFIDQIARRATPSECKQLGFKYTDGNKACKVPYLDITRHCIVYVHPNSSTAATSPPPEYVVYCVLQRVKRKPSSTIEDHHQNTDGRQNPPQRALMRGVTLVAKEWLVAIGYEEERYSRIYSDGRMEVAPLLEE